MFGRVPNLLMGSFAGITALGYFERSLYVPRLVNVMLSQLYGKVGFAVYSKVKNQPARIARGLELSLFWLSRIVFLPAVFVFVYPKFILTTMLGEKWEYATPLFQGFALFGQFKRQVGQTDVFADRITIAAAAQPGNHLAVCNDGFGTVQRQPIFAADRDGA